MAQLWQYYGHIDRLDLTVTAIMARCGRWDSGARIAEFYGRITTAKCHIHKVDHIEDVGIAVAVDVDCLEVGTLIGWIGLDNAVAKGDINSVYHINHIEHAVALGISKASAAAIGKRAVTRCVAVDALRTWEVIELPQVRNRPPFGR